MDDTLLDFYSAFSTAQRNIAEKLGIEPSKEYLETDEKCGWKAWEESGLDKTEERDVQENYHVLYYQYLRKHFEYLLETLSDFLPYTYRLYISEKIGFIKPTEDFYDYVMNDLKCRLEECLMIGDSITNDMIGAKAIGMDVCYYNAKRKRIPENVLVDYEVNSIHELIQILL